MLPDAAGPRPDVPLAGVSVPTWLRHALTLHGRCRVPDAGLRAPRPVLWWPRLAMWWGDVAVPDSARLVAHALRHAGLQVPARWWLWRPWLEWGVPSGEPAAGAVALVYGAARAPWLGLVLDNQPADGRLAVLTLRGADPVQLVPVNPRHVVAYRWPAERAALRTGFLLPPTPTPSATPDDDVKGAA